MPPAPSAGTLSGSDPSGGRLFWRAQVGGWLAFGVIYYLAILPQSPVPALMLLAFKVLWAMTGLVVSSVLGAAYRALRLGERGIGFAVASATILSFAVAVAWVLGLGGAALASTGSTRMLFTPSSFPFVASNHVFILLAWSGGYLTLVYWRKVAAQERSSLAARGLAREAQLEMLRYQLNPHFLFNAMTSARALIAEDPERARETLTRLADFLRYTLNRRNGPMATVAEEIETVRNYLAIERVRFEERLEVAIHVEPTAAEERIPGFLLHPLVENAIKYGSALDGRLQIVVRAWIAQGRLTLEVANTGALSSASEHGTLVGLRNVRDRLATVWPTTHTFTLDQDGAWVRATIAVELDTGARA